MITNNSFELNFAYLSFFGYFSTFDIAGRGGGGGVQPKNMFYVSFRLTTKYRTHPGRC